MLKCPPPISVNTNAVAMVTWAVANDVIEGLPGFCRASRDLQILVQLAILSRDAAVINVNKAFPVWTLRRGLRGA